MRDKVLAVSVILVCVAALFSLSQCEKVPLTATEGSTLFITANPTAIPAIGGVSTITVTGFKRVEDGGGPLPNGTQIFFTTNVGLIEERVAMENGVARGYLRGDGRAGLAAVAARSGAGIEATLATPVLVGNATGINILVTANPATVGPPDFTSNILATVFDNDNNPLSNVPLVFSTSAGALASNGSILRTNELGQASDRLTLENEQSATVTATSGTVNATTTVTRGTSIAPIVSSVSPTIVDRDTTVNVTISGLNFQPGAVVSFGEGVAVNAVNFVNSTTLVATITTNTSATTGTRTVTVTNPDGQSGTLAGVFRVGRVPIVTGVDPPTLGAGSDQSIQIFGVNFSPGLFVSFSGSGVTVVPGTIVVSSDGTTIDLDINVAAGATGQRSVTVTNPDGGSGTLANAFEPTG